MSEPKPSYPRDLSAVVVALAFQVAWTCTRALLERRGVAPTNAYVVALSVSALAASYVTIAAAAGGFAMRLSGTRRVGAWIALIGSLALVAGVALYEALLHSSAEHPSAMTWAIALRVRGWSIADAVAILGLAIAAGRLWLAPPTIGLALLNAQPGLTKASWSTGVLVGLLVAKAALIVIIAASAEREAAPRQSEPERALAALRRCELWAWLSAGLTLTGAMAWFSSPTIYVAIATAVASVAVAMLFAVAAWSIARAAIAASPAWLWCASAMFTAWGFCRTIRAWSLTFMRHWGDLEATRLKTIDWSAAVPGLLAALCALSAVVVFAQRSGAGAVTRAALASAAFFALGFSVQCVRPEETAARVACYVIANVTAALAYRVARSAISGDVPRARVV